MIELKNLSKAFGKDKQVIENLNCTIPDNAIYGFKKRERPFSKHSADYLKKRVITTLQCRKLLTKRISGAVPSMHILKQKMICSMRYAGRFSVTSFRMC